MPFCGCFLPTASFLSGKCRNRLYDSSLVAREVIPKLCGFKQFPRIPETTWLLAGRHSSQLVGLCQSILLRVLARDFPQFLALWVPPTPNGNLQDQVLQDKKAGEVFTAKMDNTLMTSQK